MQKANRITGLIVLFWVVFLIFPPSVLCQESKKKTTPNIHIIHFAGPINLITTERIRDICLQAITQGATEIRLHFSSDGGSTMYGFTLYNFLKSINIPLTIHNIGNVQSVALPVFLAGSKRLASSASRFLIHALHWNFSAKRVSHARLREFVSSLDNDLERYAQIFDEQTRGAKDPVDIRIHLSGQEKILTASDALASGIVHEVSEATIPKGAVTWWVSAH